MASTENEVMERLTRVIRKVLNQSQLELNAKTTAEDVKGWDSLNHMQIIVSVEKEFQIKFTLAEITGFNNVGDLVAAIIGKNVHQRKN